MRANILAFRQICSILSVGAKMKAIIGFISDKKQKEIEIDVPVISGTKKVVQSKLKDEAAKYVDRTSICYVMIKSSQ